MMRDQIHDVQISFTMQGAMCACPCGWARLVRPARPAEMLTASLAEVQRQLMQDQAKRLCAEHLEDYGMHQRAVEFLEKRGRVEDQ